ncbi:hypothetical protein LXI61_004554, partial [Salmonella enterica subsp. enterica serovar Agbeni]|nr:hypothetical protein [Salmonella enterica subsp. enterica serovar Agbeni]
MEMEGEHSKRTFSYNRLDQLTEVILTPTAAGQKHGMQADRVRLGYDRSGWL